MMDTYPVISCPFCELVSKQEKRFYLHLKEKHSIFDPEMCYVTHVLKTDKRPTCQCSPECQETISWTGWKQGYLSKYVRGHNARVASAFNDKELQKEMALKRSEGYSKGRYAVWNKGLSRETDARVDAMSEKIGRTLNEGYASGRIVDWHETQPEKALVAARKTSETKKERYTSGQTKNWNEGLTKETDERVATSAQKLSDGYRDNREFGRRLSIAELAERVSKLKGVRLITPLEDYRSKHSQKLVFRCLECDNDIIKTLGVMENNALCTTCFPTATLPQLEVYEFVQALAPETKLSDWDVIPPLEIDVHVPGRLGIEYDGLWWHSEKFLNADKIVRKLRLCDAAGLPLLRIFADEWRDKRRVVESMIRHRLGLHTHRVGARECNIIELKSAERFGFIETNHLEGDVPATIAWGLEHDGKLLAALSLRRPYQALHKDKLEVARFCLAPSVSVPGALSRLSKAALRWAKQQGKLGLMTYVDRRVGSAKGYVAAGFEMKRETAPRFWWTDFNSRFDRFSIRANSKEGITEAMAAEKAGVHKVWGCPNVVLEMLT